MRRVLRWILILCAVIVVTVVIGLYGAIHYINSDKFKDDLVIQVREDTGRELSIAGDLEFSVYPWAGVTVSQVSLSNAAGFGEAPFFKAEQIALRIKTLPLLRQQYELDTFKLHGAELNLARNKEGVPNWADLVKPGEEPAGDIPELSAVVLGGVDIRQARISWDDQQSGRQIKIHDLDAATGALTYGAPIELTLTMHTESNKPAVKKRIALKGVLNYDLENEIYAIRPLSIDSVVTGKNVPGGQASSVMSAGIELNLGDETASIRDLSLRALDTELKANLTATGVQSGAPGLTGQLELSGQDLAKLVRVLEIEPLATDLAKLKDRSFTVSTELQTDLSEDAVAVPKLRISGLGAEIDARLDLRQVRGKTPSASGKLDARGSDLPVILQLLSPFLGADATQISAIGKQLAAGGDKGFAVNTEFDADLDKGMIRVPTLSARLPGASVKGQLNAEGIQTDKPNVAGDLTAQGQNISGLLQILAGLRGGDAAAMGKALAGLKDPAFTVNAVFDSGKQAGSIELSKLNFSGLDTRVESAITVANLKAGAPTVSGTLNTTGKDLPRLLQVAGALQAGGTGIIALGRDLNKSGGKSFSVNTQFDANLASGAVNVPVLTAKLLGAEITGAVNTAADSTIKGQLKASGSDLPSLLRLAGNLQGGESGLGTAGKKLSSMKAKSFVVDAACAANQQAGDIDVPKLSATALGLEIAGALKARGFKDKRGNIDGNLSVKGTNLRDLLTAYDQKNLAGVLQTVNLNAGISGSGGAMQFKPFALKAVLAGKTIPNSPVDLSLTGDVSANLDKQTFAIKNLSLKGLGLDAGGSVDATKIQEAPEFKGILTVAPFNLRELLKQLNQNPPVTADPATLNKVSFSSQFSGSASSIAFKELSLGLDDTQVKGDASVINFARPAITFGFGVNQINMD
ncbi:MAG: AsmA family protein, partial [Thiotrichales bacterium]|nr:AsmA family protein [Thiotrichales bacterium]